MDLLKVFQTGVTVAMDCSQSDCKEVMDVVLGIKLEQMTMSEEVKKMFNPKAVIVTFKLESAKKCKQCNTTHDCAIVEIPPERAYPKVIGHNMS